MFIPFFERNIEKHIKRTTEINQIYRDELSDYFWDFQNERETDRSNMWLTCALMKGEHKPEDLIQHLEKDNIEARRIWKPMHQQPIMSTTIRHRAIRGVLQ